MVLDIEEDLLWTTYLPSTDHIIAPLESIDIATKNGNEIYVMAIKQADENDMFGGYLPNLENSNTYY